MLLARCGELSIGAVRLACEQGPLALRTMQVHPDWQRRELGLGFCDGVCTSWTTANVSAARIRQRGWKPRVH